MTSSTQIPSPESIDLNGISWQTYEALVRDLSRSRRLRLTYHLGNLEIMVPSPDRELYKETLGRLVETLAEELDVRLFIYQRQDDRYIERDRSLFFGNICGREISVFLARIADTDYLELIREFRAWVRTQIDR